MKDNPDQVKKFLESIPYKFNIVETGIDIHIQKEYVEYSGTFEQGKLNEKETLFLSSVLFDKDKPVEIKKRVLVLLAHLGTILAFRQIEKYIENNADELKHWSLMALHECKMFLENELLDESVGLIMSGLGGIDNKLRYYFLLLSINEQPFTATQKNIINNEFSLVCKKLTSTLEKIDFSDCFVGLTVLVSHYVAIGTVIDSGIKKCNELGEFIFEHYYVTNMNIPNQSEIIDIIEIVKEGE
jgi:hypothetical protein